MADAKISNLTELTTPSATDVLPIVNGGVTKKIQYSNLVTENVTILEATGTIDDSNTTFTFSSSPSLIVVNGAVYRNGHGCTIAGLNVTLDNPVGTGGDIYGIA